MNVRLKYATSKEIDSATAVIFGAHTKTAGSSESYLGMNKIRNDLFSADAVRIADNESPSLPENLLLGDKLFDMGNIAIKNVSQGEEVNSVKTQYLNIFRQSKVAFCLGGDHIIKYAALQAINSQYQDCWIAYIDAHPDCNIIDELNYSSILHWGFKLPAIKPENTSLIGLRQLNEAEANAFKYYQPTTIWGSHFASISLDKIYHSLKKRFSNFKRVYISIDLDGLDPSNAPAVEAPYPGGPSLNQIILLIRMIAHDFNIVGVDISEFIPEIDHYKITALTSARLIKEIYAVL